MVTTRRLVRTAVDLVGRPPLVPQSLWPATVAGRVFQFCVPPVLDAALDRIDLTQVIIDHVSVPRIVDAMDVDAVLDAADVASIAANVVDDIDLPGLIRVSTGALASDTVIEIRRQSASADDVVSRGRKSRRIGSAGGVVRPAGIVTRLLASAVDLATVIVAAAGAYLAVVGALFVISPRRFHWPDNLGWSIPTAILVVAVPYLSLAWCITGRTVGGAVLGIRVSSFGGGRVGFVRALARAVLCIAVPLGLLFVPFTRRHRSLADLLLRTEVRYEPARAEAVRPPTRVRRSLPPAPGGRQPQYPDPGYEIVSSAVGPAPVAGLRATVSTAAEKGGIA